MLPETRESILNGLNVVTVGVAARESLFIALAGRGFPDRKVFPEDALNVQMMLDRIGVNDSR
jgi:hypothetical protein